MAARSTKAGARTKPRWVALIRGINVGGNNMLPMADLSRMFAKAGCGEVRTYIQSGNVVFIPPASAPAARRVPQHVSEQIQTRFGFTPAIMLRSGEEMKRTVRCNPFLTSDVDLKTLHVGFFAEEPDAELVARLDPSRSPGDRFVVRGREIFLHYANGLGRSKLTSAYIDSILAIRSTIRNWRTVMTLTELMSASS